MKRLYPIVLVEWVDSSTGMAKVWTKITDIGDTPARVQSAGFLVRSSKDSIVIASSADKHHAAGYMHIPRKAILSMTTVRK